MIDFACKTVDVRTVVQCAFGLRRGDMTVLESLFTNKSWCTSEELVAATSLDRSSVQRSLKRLSLVNLCERRQENAPGGGYRYHYRAISHAQLSELVLRSLDSFRDRLRVSLAAGSWMRTSERKKRTG